MNKSNFPPEAHAEATLEYVKLHGATVVPALIPPAVVARAAEMLETEPLEPFEGQHNKVPEQYQFRKWAHPNEWPGYVRELGQFVINFAIEGGVAWAPNEAKLQRYLPGQAGIGWHRDWPVDCQLVAVATLEGTARFEAELDHYAEPASWRLRPGDVVLLRAPGLSGENTGRPRHRILPPTQGRRTSLGFRQVSAD